MKWMKDNYYEYQPMKDEDAVLFHNIPLAIYQHSKKKEKIILQ